MPFWCAAARPGPFATRHALSTRARATHGHLHRKRGHRGRPEPACPASILMCCAARADVDVPARVHSRSTDILFGIAAPGNLEPAQVRRLLHRRLRFAHVLWHRRRHAQDCRRAWLYTCRGFEEGHHVSARRHRHHTACTLSQRRARQQWPPPHRLCNCSPRGAVTRNLV